MAISLTAQQLDGLPHVVLFDPISDACGLLTSTCRRREPAEVVKEKVAGARRVRRKVWLAVAGKTNLGLIAWSRPIAWRLRLLVSAPTSAPSVATIHVRVRSRSLHSNPGDPAFLLHHPPPRKTSPTRRLRRPTTVDTRTRSVLPLPIPSDLTACGPTARRMNDAAGWAGYG